SQTIDYELLFDTIKNLSQKFQIEKICYDKFNSALLIPRLQEQGILCEIFAQNATSFNFPIKYVFYLKRKNREIPEKIFNYTKKHLLRSPFINALILICSLTIGHIFFLIFALNLKGQNEFILSMVWQIFFISIIASYLFVLLIFFWHRSRVQRFYIDHIFTKDELKKKIDTKFKMSISKRLVISSLMTTIFPLATVLFYVLLSFSISHNIGEFDNSQLRLLFGDIVKVFDNLGITNTVFDSIHSSKTGHNLKILYINGINSIEMLIGILNGTIISLLYVFLFVRWTKKDIVSPIRELLSNMEKTKNGDLESFSIVRTNDEIGDLTEGYNSMLKGLQEREKIKHLFGQYLTKEISDEILKGNINLNGESYQATVMFCDIRDFTSISEKITTVEVFSFLNCYLDRMIDVILENNGIIDKFIGDGILAIFGVPVRSDNHSEDAVRSAFAMQKALKELNDDRIKNGQFPIKIGIGVHTGHLIAGNIGNSKKLEYTVIGDTVNIASRIEKLTKEYSTSLLISETTFNNLKPGFVEIEKAKKISDIEIRGKNERFNLYLW
ncbi:MAG TPA: adenylate/guanylate cyclase domain-containing protein, partial [Spirochaetota bacterium]|nr:adenylate/guanylate cyclase domain-containing protein [Spirochaetota bacterium]